MSGGRAKKAEALCRQIIRKRAGHPGALRLLAQIARQEGRSERALQLLEKGEASAPDDVAVLTDLGNLLKSLGRIEEAATRHRRVLEILPNSPFAMSNLASTYVRGKRIGEAVDLFGRAIELAPKDAEIAYNLGNALIADERFDVAADAMRRVLSLVPDHVGARSNLGVALREMGRPVAAVDALRQAVARAPDYGDAWWNLSLALLMDGRYADGWAAYEWRRRIPGFAVRPVEGEPWEGGDLAGRTLLVHAEQGLGDTFQFARYLPLAAGKGGRTVFACQDAIVPLLSAIDGMPPIVGDGDRLPEFDVHAPLMSLPYLLGIAAPHIPDEIGYLTAEPARRDRWRAALSGPALKIGIAWQGRPQYKADHRRSIPLRNFSALASVPGVSLHSLQRGFGTEQLAASPWGSAVGDFGERFDSDGAFLDTAAVISELDLVITSDTAIAHLAGALGTETWVALARIPDWRWGLKGETCPWYPSMRLFRQETAGDWFGVFERIAAEITERASGRTG